MRTRSRRPEAIASRTPSSISSTELRSSKTRWTASRSTRPAWIPSRLTGVEQIVMCCLEKEANKRYRDGAALAAELKRFLDGEALTGP